MADRVKSLLAIEASDRPVLGLLGPTFAVTAAASVVIASVAKSLFLFANPLEALPWVYIGSSLFTAIASLGYVTAMRRFGVERRFPTLLAAGVSSLVALWLAFDLDPRLVSLVIFVWCPGILHLVTVQGWNVASTMLPTRQVKRLVPILAGVATVGAALGGAVVSLLLRWLTAEDLLLFAALLLAVPLVRIRGVLAALRAANPEQIEAPLPGTAPPPVRESEVARGFRNILKTPLLLRLAAFVFLMQVASLIVDYQFSGELKANFEKDDMASFLGGFYWTANVAVLLFSLFATGRFVQVLGIGMAVSAVGLVVAAGSGAYMIAHIGLGLGAFQVMVATAFGEHVGKHALTRGAVQMLITPLDTRKSERAKTLIDGVVYHAAKILMSLVLLLWAPGVDALHMLSPATVIACVVVLLIGLRIGPHYRRALFEGLRARRLDTAAARYLRHGVGRRVVDDLAQRLRSETDPDVIRQTLAVVREMKVQIDDDVLEALSRRSEPPVVQAALAAYDALGRAAPLPLLRDLLGRDGPPEILREALSALQGREEADMLPLFERLSRHEETGVASLAYISRMRAERASGDVPVPTAVDDDAVGHEPTPLPVGAPRSTAEQRIVTDLASAQPMRRARAARVTGQTGIFNFAQSTMPALLEDPDERVRLEAVEAMGQLRLPTFVTPLLSALERGDLRHAALEALVRFGPDLVPPAAQALRGDHSVVARISLLNALERVDAPQALMLLMDQAKADVVALRDQAILSLWRMSRDAERNMRPPEPWLVHRAAKEIDRLERYVHAEALGQGIDVRRAFFLSELENQRVGAERRAFRLLGMLYNRAAIHRAWLHYRGASRRTRSNAVELLDQHITHPELRPFVSLVERVQDAAGNLRLRIDDVAVQPGKTVEDLLTPDEVWLRRVWHWAVERGEDTAGGAGADDDVELVLLLKGIPLFSQMSGQDLLPVAAIVEPQNVDGSAMIFSEAEPGDRLYLIVGGRVEVIKEERVVATLGRKECFGEMALLDNAPRSASVRAAEPLRLLAIAAEDFHDQLELHPALARGIIAMLSRRIRDTGHAR